MPVIKLLFVPSGELRRLPSHDDRSPTFAELEQHARSFFALGADKPLHFKYVDDEGDVVTVSSDGEVADAFAQARAALRSLKFAVAPRGGDAPPPAARGGRGRVAVHHGVTCDASGMSPIVGTRYHLPGQDYDLCEQEFAKLDADARAPFVKIERPRRICGGPRRGGRSGGCEMLGAMLGPIAATVADALEEASVAAAAQAEDKAKPHQAPTVASAARTPVDIFAQFFDACANAAVADEDALDAELQKAIASSVGGQSSGPSTSPTSAPAAPQAHAAPQAPAVQPAPAPAAPAASEEKSDDGYVAVSPPPTPKAADAPHVPAVATTTTRFDGELAELASLGFGDDADRNIALLERYNGRVMRVVNAILDMTED